MTSSPGDRGQSQQEVDVSLHNWRQPRRRWRRSKELARSVLQLPVLGPVVTSLVGRLGHASAAAAPRLDTMYRRLPIAAGLPYGTSVHGQREALLAYYDRLRYRLSRSDFQPVISVLVPTYRPNLEYFAQTLASVGVQTYPNWQLCVVDDASGEPDVARLVAQFADRHPGRVAFMARESNGHISRASNDALALATGDYVALLDHDDRLYPNALAEVVLGLQESRAADGRYPEVLYTDERIIDEFGRPQGDVWRKPDWMPLLHLTSNYTNHLTVYSRELLDRLGGFRVGFEGSQDHDLMLRATEATEAAGLPVVHIPALAYQWRSHSESVAKNPEAKSYSVDAAVTAVAEACQRRGTPARVWREPGSVPNRIDFDLPDPWPRIAVVLRAVGGDRQRALRSLQRGSYPHLEILDETDDRAPEGVLLQQALDQCDADFLAVFADDLEAIRLDWAEAMVRLATQANVGVVGGLVLDEHDRIVSAGLLGAGATGVAPAMAGTPFSERVYLSWPASIHEVLAVSADAMMLDVAAARAVNGFDTGALAAQFSDIDICLRLREHGLSSVFTPYARFRLQRRRSDEPMTSPTERDALVRRWAAQLTRDPYLNPGLVRSPGFTVDPQIWLPEVPPELFEAWLSAGRVG